MKRFLYFSFILSLSLVLFLFSPSQLLSQNESISSFTSQILVLPSARVEVTETIVYDFGSSQRHGIFRNLPLVYTNSEGKKFKITVDVQGVTDETGSSYQYKMDRSNNKLSIKIGDPDRLIAGKHTYTINYFATGVITYFSDHDELFWNVTGNDWKVSINKAKARVMLPQDTEIKKTVCYTGLSESRQQRCVHTSSDSQAIFDTENNLPAGEGLTITVAFPKGVVAVVEPKEVGKKSIVDWIILTLIAVVSFFYYLVAPFVVGLLWWRYGRDPDVGLPPSAWFNPPKDQRGKELSPAEVGTLVDEKADNRDVTATIVDLAIRGFLKIKEKNKNNYEIKKQEIVSTERLKPFEKQLLDSLFEKDDKTTTKELGGKFYRQVNKVKETLYKTVAEKGFFPEDPNAVRNRYLIFAIISFILGFNLPLGITLLLFGRVMPRKTLAGAKAQQIALALKNFLGSQERQLKFQVKHWYMFEKLLPYAVVFGVEKIWAERFADLAVSQPEWYEGPYKGQINPVIFTQSLSRSIGKLDTIGITPSSTRSSTGFSSGFSSGGFSGGGFGGGGGGSW